MNKQEEKEIPVKTYFLCELSRREDIQTLNFSIYNINE